ncbi:MAG: GNAT family N-acetyltransferase [Patescibacteria group bacterium]|nr:GNAT family N-acetyltransferase [Patescibacteria group bacterium]
MPYQIRQLNLEDLSRPSFFQTLANLRPIENLSPEVAESIFKDCVRLGIETYVALDGGEVIGTLRLLLEPKFYHQGRLAAHIEDVATRADYQGKGVASALIRRVLEICRVKNCYRLTLDCSDELVDFYRRFNFHPHNHSLRLDFDD